MSKGLFLISEYCCSLKRNLFTMVLMTLMAVLLLVSASLVLREWHKYEPFSDFKDQQGFVYSESTPGVSLGSYQVQYYNVYRTTLVGGEDVRMHFNSCVYPDWVLDSFRPRLLAGNWLHSGDDRNRVVIGSEVGDYQVGDTIVLTCYLSDGTEEDISFEVAGILAENTALLFGADVYSADDKGYNMCYRGTDRTSVTVIMSKAAADRLGLSVNESTWHVAVYEEEVSSDDYNEIYGEIFRNAGGAVRTLEDFVRESENLIHTQLATYLPIVLFGIVLVFTGVYTAAHINLKMGMRHHTIFLLVGASPAQRLKVTLIDVLINAGLSVTLFAMICLLIERTGLRGMLVVDFTGEIYAVIIVYYLVNILASVLFYVLAWRNISPKEALIARKA